MPEASSPNRRRARRSALTIHVLEHGRYREAAKSRAVSVWTAAEIHVALNEPEPLEQTSAVLERVGGVLGAREGTGPDATCCCARSGEPDLSAAAWKAVRKG